MISLPKKLVKEYPPTQLKKLNEIISERHS